MAGMSSFISLIRSSVRMAVCALSREKSVPMYI